MKLSVVILTERKVGLKDSALDSEELTRGPDSSPAVSSQPPRVALFPGVDASALKVTSHEILLTFPVLTLLKRFSLWRQAQLRKRGDSDNHSDAPVVPQSQPSRSPKSPFLPRAARVLPPAGGKENG